MICKQEEEEVVFVLPDVGFGCSSYEIRETRKKGKEREKENGEHASKKEEEDKGKTERDDDETHRWS